MDLIFITSRFPYPINKGDKLRAYYQIIDLAKNNRIHLISFSDKHVSESNIAKLEKYCASINVYKLGLLKRGFNLLRTFFNNKPFQVNYFYNKKYQKKIDNLINEIKPDHIFCQLIRTALYMKNQHYVPSTIDYMDALSKGIYRRINISNFWMKPILRMEYERLKNFENLAYEFFDNHLIISKADRNEIMHQKNNTIHVIPNGIDHQFYAKQELDKKFDLVFIGNLSYVPNIEAANYIANELVPILIKDYPNLNVLIAGSDPTYRVKKLANKHITINGWVKDIRKAYCSGKIFIAPMKIGTGLQNKLLEAMSLEIPCITSDLANKSLKANPKENILIANSTEEFATCIKQCLENEELRRKIGEGGRKFIIKNYNWEDVNKQLLNLFQSKQIEHL